MQILNEKPQWFIYPCLVGWKLTPIFFPMMPVNEPAKAPRNAQAQSPEILPENDLTTDHLGAKCAYWV